LASLVSMPTLPSHQTRMLHHSSASSLRAPMIGQQRRLLHHSLQSTPMIRQQSGNSTFDRIASSQGGRSSNATFDLLSSHPFGMMSSSDSVAPRPNIFALSAQDILSAAHPIASINIGRTINSSLFARERSYPHRRQTVKGMTREDNELTSCENNELTTFLANFAATLSDKECDMCDGEPNPLPPS